MKQLYAMLIVLVSVSPITLKAQVAINTDASNPDPSAMLDVKSTTKGMLVPRVTTASRTAIASPADGLMVYDTDTKTFWYYMTGTGWNQMLTTGGTTAFAIPYTATVSSPLPLFALSNPGSGPAIQATATGMGNAATVVSSNSANTANALNVTTNSTGNIADHMVGNAGNFVNSSATGAGAGVRGETSSQLGNNGTAGVYGTASGTGGYGGYFEHSGTTGFGLALQASTNGPGVCANFVANNTSSTQTVLNVTNNGRGTGLLVDQEGNAGDAAIFQKNGANVARINRNGKGFFNAGTQNSGADVAEAFDVEGNIAGYEPGDVLLISTTTDRTVVRSNEAYSSLVAGVYATKPGVLLTELNIDADLTGKVPMGVVGVIPTKVCGEGGAIHRGDILVTSSRAGYAMRADLDKLKPGQAIGKALQDFVGDSGKINVLVNVK